MPTPEMSKSIQQSKTVDEIESLFERLRENEISQDRIISLTSGTKVPNDPHADPKNRDSLQEITSAQLSSKGTYGVYPNNGLLFIDIDDYDGAVRPPAFDELPETFTVKSAHGGVHYYYAVPEESPERIKDEFGSTNLKGDWGEVRSYNQYVVGPGSQLDGCSKDWCDSCSDSDGGWYTVANDHQIAEIEIKTLMDILRDVVGDREASEEPASNQSNDSDTFSETQSPTEYPEDYDPVPSNYTADKWIDERALETDETLRNLWNGNYSSVGCGNDRSQAEYVLAWKLAWWLGLDKDRVRRQMNRASTKKWERRTDPEYRESILKAVDKQDEFYSGSAVNVVSVSENLDVESLTTSEPTSITLSEARERTQEAIRGAFDSGDQILVEALPTLGKSYGAIRAAAETNLPVTFLTARRDLYDDIREWCADHGLSCRVLPAMTERCPSYSDDPDTSLERKLVEFYERGATPRQIHNTLDGLPCQQDGECPSMNAWDFDVDDYEVLFGNYTQANVNPLVEDRVVVVDECPDGEFDVVVDDHLGQSVSTFLSDLCEDDEFDLSDGTPATYRGLTQLNSSSSTGESIRSAIEAYIAQRDMWDPESDSNSLVTRDYERVHRRAPEAAYAVLCGEDEFNGYERVEMLDGTLLLHDPDEIKVHVRDPPSLEDAHSVVCLDGTPTRRLWESALGISFDDHVSVLDEEERQSYVADVQEWEFVQTTTEYVYNYTRRENVNAEKSAAFVEAVHRRHEQRPTVISTKAGIDALQNSGVICEDDATTHYGDLKSSNDFVDHDLGIVLGTHHLPRQWVKREAAFEAETISPEDDGVDKTYNSEYGNALLTHMREHEVLQAAMRFGRDENTDARVYIHTACLPDWVPAIKQDLEIHTHANTAREGVIETLDVTEPPWTKTGLYEEDRIEVSKRQIGNILRELREQGVLERDESSQPYEYEESDLDRINPFGIVDGL